MEVPGGNGVHEAWGRVRKIGSHVRSLGWVLADGSADARVHGTLVSLSSRRLSVILLVLTGVFVTVFALVGYGVGPLVVAEAAQRRGFAPLVTYIQKKPPRSIAYVMEYLLSLVRGALLLVGLGGGVLALVVWPPFQHWWDRLQGSAALDVPLLRRGVGADGLFTDDLCERWAFVRRQGKAGG